LIEWLRTILRMASWNSAGAAANSATVLTASAFAGPGLAADCERLFETFYTTKPSGLGMGLPVCRTIVEAHGGRLWATPNVPHGAIFQFTVPILPEAN